MTLDPEQVSEYETNHATNPAPADAPWTVTIHWRGGAITSRGFSTKQAAERWLADLQGRTHGITRTEIKETR